LTAITHEPLATCSSRILVKPGEVSQDKIDRRGKRTGNRLIKGQKVIQ